jgi:hypothetical protein
MIRDRRGVSNVVSAVLLIGIVFAGMAVIVGAGGLALADAQQQLDADRAEKVMTQFDSRAAMVALGGTNYQEVTLASGQGADYTLHEDTGWMNVTIKNTTSGERTTVLNVTLGTLAYSDGETTVAYQGGGVWTQRDGGTTMVSPPEFHFREATLTLPVVVVDGDPDPGLTAAIARNGTVVEKYPNRSVDRNFTNPLTDGRVNVTVHSDYYESWGRYFTRRTEGGVVYDHDRETATVRLVVPASGRRVTSALTSTSNSGTLSLTGSGSEVTRTDSYTSADGDGYGGDDHSGGNITVAGTLDIGGNACVDGSVAGDRVITNGNANNCGSPYKVTGDVRYATSESVDSGDYGGTLSQFDGVSADSRIDSLIDDRVDAIRDDPDTNTNGDVGEASEDLEFGGDDTAELDAGNYYVRTLDIDGGETVEADTSSGDVVIAVEEDLNMRGSAEIQVTGSGQLKVYVKGEGVGTQIVMEKNSGDAPRIDVPGRNSTRFWLYGKSDFSGELKGSNEDVLFEGVIYAPGGPGGTGTVSISKAEVYGAVVASDVDVSQGGEFHYDRALSDRRAIEPNENLVAITYLHVSVNRINVTSE